MTDHIAMDKSAAEDKLAAEPLAPEAAIHLGYLDGLRALAALFVVYLHCCLLLPWSDSFGRLGLLMRPFYTGHFPVDVFIVLSGFSLMLPVARGGGALSGGASKFYLKRLRRILPPYYLAFGFALLLTTLLISHKTGTYWDGSIPVTLNGVLRYLFLLQDVSGVSEIDPVLWSVAVEWRIYFLFPLLVIAFRKFGGLATTVGVVISSYVAWAILIATPLRHVINSTPTGVSPYYIGLFAMGMFASDIAYGRSRALGFRRDPRFWAAATAALGLLVCVLSVAHLPHGVALPARIAAHGHILPLQIMSLFVGAFAFALLLWTSLDPRSWICRLLSWRPLVFAGAFAYSIYLIHYPLIQVIWQYAIHPLKQGPRTEFVILIGLGMPVIVGIAYLFFLACERPFLNSKRRKQTIAETERDAALSPAP